MIKEESGSWFEQMPSIGYLDADVVDGKIVPEASYMKSTSSVDSRGYIPRGCLVRECALMCIRHQSGRLTK